MHSAELPEFEVHGAGEECSLKQRRCEVVISGKYAHGDMLEELWD